MDYPDAADARVRVLSEADLASALRERGERVVEHRGRFWTPVAPGFWMPIHPLARLTAEQATRPALASWGYMAAMQGSVTSRANGVIVTYLVRDLEGYGEACLTRRKREALRQCRRQVRVVQLTDSRLLDQQGHQVYLSYAQRLGVRDPLDVDAYQRMVQSWWDGRRLVLAGLIGDRLVGYMDSYAAEGTLYLNNIHVLAAAFPTNITTGLYFETLEAYRRSALVTEAVGGLHQPEKPGLTTFKASLGFEVVAVPAYHRMIRPVGALFRRLRPLTYYRLTGQAVPATDQTLAS